MTNIFENLDMSPIVSLPDAEGSPLHELMSPPPPRKTANPTETPVPKPDPTDQVEAVRRPSAFLSTSADQWLDPATMPPSTAVAAERWHAYRTDNTDANQGDEPDPYYFGPRKTSAFSTAGSYFNLDAILSAGSAIAMGRKANGKLFALDEGTLSTAAPLETAHTALKESLENALEPAHTAATKSMQSLAR